MGVISNNGVIGIVKETSKYFSTVSILHSQSKISVSIKNNHFGSLQWMGKAIKARIYDIPSHVNLKIETITTSGFSYIFPSNIDVGVISQINTEMMINFIILITFLEDLKIKFVNVCESINKIEKINLEKTLMSNLIIKYKRFLLFILLQIFIFNNVLFLGYINPYIPFIHYFITIKSIK